MRRAGRRPPNRWGRSARPGHPCADSPAGLTPVSVGRRSYRRGLPAKTADGRSPSVQLGPGMDALTHPAPCPAGRFSAEHGLRTPTTGNVPAVDRVRPVVPGVLFVPQVVADMYRPQACPRRARPNSGSDGSVAISSGARSQST